MTFSHLCDPRQLGHAVQDVRALGELLQRAPRPDFQSEPIDDQLPVLQMMMSNITHRMVTFR